MDSQQIRSVRSFNRAVTQRLGVLADNFLDRGRPLSEARLLYEIGQGATDLRELRAKLSLDSGYLSRLLRSLEGQGLARSGRAAHDGRVTTVGLTRKGTAEVRELDRRSERFAAAILGPLNAEQRERLVGSMAEVERLMRAAAVDISIVRPHTKQARWCLQQYFDELAQRFETGFDPAQSISASDEQLVPPAGLFLIARLDGEPIGCGALKLTARRIAEVKRMWVASAARGLGVGRRILEAIEQHALAMGVRTLRLETNRTLKEAQALYRRSGYRDVPRFNDERYAHHWFEKKLQRPRSARR